MRKIYFRADASTEIGFGHFVRTLALVEMLKDKFDCIFATVQPTTFQLHEIEKQCKAISLSSESHFDDFLNLLDGTEIVVLDNYFFSTEYQKKIKLAGCSLVCIDDMHDKHYVSDIIINHSITNPDLFSAEPYTSLCLGFEWALIRKPFRDHAMRNNMRTNKQQIEKVAVSFGGVDKYNLTGQTIDFLLSLPKIKCIQAIVGSQYKVDTKHLNNKKLQFFQNVSATEISSIFSTTDMAVVSSSTICIEALACNTLVAAGYYVDNQIGVYEQWNNNKYILGLGNLLETPYLELLNNYIIKCGVALEKPSFGDIQNNYIQLFENI